MQRAPFTLQGRSMHRSRCTAVPAARRTARDAHGAAVMHARLAAQSAPRAAQRCSAYSLPCCAPRYLLHRCSAHRAARGFVTMRAPLAVQRCSEHRSLTRPAVQRLLRYLQPLGMYLWNRAARGVAVPRCRGVAVRGRAARCAGLHCETLVVQRYIGCRARGSGAVGVNTTQLPAPGGLQARLLKGVVMCHDCASLWWRWRTSAARGTAKPAIVEILRQTVAGLMYVENDAVTTFTGTVTPVTRDSNSTSSC